MGEHAYALLESCAAAGCWQAAVDHTHKCTYCSSWELLACNPRSAICSSLPKHHNSVPTCPEHETPACRAIQPPRTHLQAASAARSMAVRAWWASTCRPHSSLRRTCSLRAATMWCALTASAVLTSSSRKASLRMASICRHNVMHAGLWLALECRTIRECRNGHHHHAVSPLTQSVSESASLSRQAEASWSVVVYR
jgi:hypothetical protein